MTYRKAQANKPRRKLPHTPHPRFTPARDDDGDDADDDDNGYDDDGDDDGNDGCGDDGGADAKC